MIDDIDDDLGAQTVSRKGRNVEAAAMSECTHGEIALCGPCIRCGAPVCCEWCCQLDERDRKIAALQAENANLRADVIEYKQMVVSAESASNWEGGQ